MYDHLILVSRERVVGTEIDETSNLIYTEIKIRTKKYDGAYLQSKDYPHLVEKELSTAEIANFKANRHLYKKVESNENGTIYQFGTDFKKMYWSMFPKVEEPPKKVFVDKKKPERTHKVCKKCKLNLPLSEFYVTSNNQLFTECKKCNKKRRNNKKKSLSLQKTI